MRRRPSKTLRDGSPTELSIHGIFHIDDMSIHTYGWERSVLAVYSHDAQCIAEYPRVVGVYSRTYLFCASGCGETVYAANTRIFTAGKCGKLITRCTAADSIEICGFAYHPYRDTYLATTRNGQIIEFSDEFRLVRSIYDRYVSDISILSSRYSAIIYTAERSVSGDAGLGVIRNGKSEYYPIGYTYSLPTLLARPNHPDILTMIYNCVIAKIDLWHSTQAIIQRNFVDPASRGVHIDSNTCVVHGSDTLDVFDYRYGLVHTRPLPTRGVCDIWFAAGRLYMSDQSGISYALDV